jgi:tetratricopeptide (TPR) repeat protein
MSHNSLGNLYRRRAGYAERAEVAYRKAIEIGEKLVQKHGADPEYRAALSQPYNGLGILYRVTGRRGEAEVAYGKARDLREQLVREFPTETNHLDDLATTFNNLANFYTDDVPLSPARQAQAEEAYRKAREITEKLVRAHPNVTDFRRFLAGIDNNVGWLYQKVGRLPEAETAFRKALEARSELARAHPKVASYQSLLASAHLNLADVFRLDARPDQAETAFRKALAIFDPLVREHREFTEFAIRCGGTQLGLGMVAADRGQFPDALEWYGRAIQTLETVLRKEKRLARARLDLSIAYEMRAKALTRLEKPAEAMKDWDRALALGKKLRPNALRSGRALTLVRLGQPERAVEEVRPLKGNPAEPSDETFFNVACVYAQASAAVGADARRPQAERDRLAGQYAARSVALLEQARAAGFFRTPVHLGYLKTDTDLDPLRPRDDFRKLLAEAAAKAG